MYQPHVKRALDIIGAIPNASVLDVGGWACPFNRANWVMDAGPFETRGAYAKVGLPASQGGDKEFFTRETWVQRDFCDRENWPFANKMFDYAICSHVLEDIRDPLFVCSEMIRVAKAGYIEFPSRLAETCRGWESEDIVGLAHHRWLIEVAGNHVEFLMKYHNIHGAFQLSFPPAFHRKLTDEQKISYLFWDDSFSFHETILHGREQHDNLEKFVAKHYQYPSYRYAADHIEQQRRRIRNGIRRRIFGD